MKKVKELKNGVIMYALEVENDFTEAQNILDENENTEIIDAESAYSERSFAEKFIGSYAVKIERQDDFNTFLIRLKKEKCEYQAFEQAEKDYYADKIDYREYRDIRNKIVSNPCSCEKCTFNPTFEQWKNNMLEIIEFNEYTNTDRTRKYKMGKYMKKLGFSQFLIDFYSEQVKEESEMILTISDKAQHIVGMSYYAEMGSWNGSGGTSCQDPRHGGDYCKSLGGALADENLFIAMLHNSLDNLEDMTDQLKARSLMRLVEIDEEQYLLPVSYYGNNKTTSMIHVGLGLLSENRIYNTDITKSDNSEDVVQWVTMNNDSFYEMYISDEVYIYETIDEYVSVECPFCEGKGKKDIYSDRLERDFEVDCPLCNGSGEYEANVFAEIDKYIEVEDKIQVSCYHDDSSYFDGYTTHYKFKVNLSKVRRDRELYTNECEAIL